MEINLRSISNKIFQFWREQIFNRMNKARNEAHSLEKFLDKQIVKETHNLTWNKIHETDWSFDVKSNDRHDEIQVWNGGNFRTAVNKRDAI